MPQYAYSLNGENWTGAFATREAALSAAIQKCSGAADPPGTVFVGELATVGGLTDHLGKGIVQEMRNRATVRGLDGASRFLRSVSRLQLEELDGELEQAVVAWLQRHKLAPESTKIEAISEHALPMPHVALRT
jgi:hypothetical protein